jgi:hypothetical protein
MAIFFNKFDNNFYNENVRGISGAFSTDDYIGINPIKYLNYLVDNKKTIYNPNKNIPEQKNKVKSKQDRIFEFRNEILNLTKKILGYAGYRNLLELTSAFSEGSTSQESIEAKKLLDWRSGILTALDSSIGNFDSGITGNLPTVSQFFYDNDLYLANYNPRFTRDSVIFLRAIPEEEFPEGCTERESEDKLNRYKLSGKFGLSPEITINSNTIGIKYFVPEVEIPDEYELGAPIYAYIAKELMGDTDFGNEIFLPLDNRALMYNSLFAPLGNNDEPIPFPLIDIYESSLLTPQSDGRLNPEQLEDWLSGEVHGERLLITPPLSQLLDQTSFPYGMSITEGGLTAFLNPGMMVFGGTSQGVFVSSSEPKNSSTTPFISSDRPSPPTSSSSRSTPEIEDCIKNGLTGEKWDVLNDRWSNRTPDETCQYGIAFCDVICDCFAASGPNGENIPCGALDNGYSFPPPESGAPQNTYELCKCALCKTFRNFVPKRFLDLQPRALDGSELWHQNSWDGLFSTTNILGIINKAFSCCPRPEDREGDLKKKEYEDWKFPNFADPLRDDYVEDFWWSPTRPCNVWKVEGCCESNLNIKVDTEFTYNIPPVPIFGWIADCLAFPIDILPIADQVLGEESIWLMLSNLFRKENFSPFQNRCDTIYADEAGPSFPPSPCMIDDCDQWTKEKIISGLKNTMEEEGIRVRQEWKFEIGAKIKLRLLREIFDIIKECAPNLLPGLPALTCRYPLLRKLLEGGDLAFTDNSFFRLVFTITVSGDCKFEETLFYATGCGCPLCPCTDPACQGDAGCTDSRIPEMIPRPEFDEAPADNEQDGGGGLGS